MSIGPFFVAHNNQCGISQPIALANGNSLYAKQTSSEKRRKVASSHRTSQTLRPARTCPRFLVRPSHRQFANLSTRSVAQVLLGRGGECGIALLVCCALMHACILPPASLLVRFAVDYVHAFSCVFCFGVLVS